MLFTDINKGIKMSNSSPDFFHFRDIQIINTFNVGLAPKLAMMHFDGCVNHGNGRAARMLQEAVGATIDGDIGPKSLGAIKRACAAPGGELAVGDVSGLRVEVLC